MMIELLEKLISIPSISGDESQLAALLSRYFIDKGYRMVTQDVDADRCNLLISKQERVKVLLCTHLDTVAPYIPFTRKGDIVYGRGACDAKGPMVAMIEAFEQTCRLGFSDVGLLFVVGEETTSEGAKKAATLSIGSKFVVVGEPTDNKVAVGQKGVLMFKLETEGVSGHSALPHQGESAIHKLVQLLSLWVKKEWGEDAQLGGSYVNIGLLNGGVGINVLAPRASAKGIFRVATSLEDIHRQIDATLPPDIRMEIPSESQPQRLLAIPDLETTVVSFGSDAAHLRPLGEIVLYGPGSIQNAHSDNEQITVAELQQAVHDYLLIINYLRRR